MTGDPVARLREGIETLGRMTRCDVSEELQALDEILAPNYWRNLALASRRVADAALGQLSRLGGEIGAGLLQAGEVDGI